MKLEMFSIFDSKVESFSPPYTAVTRGAAIRTFTDTCNDPTTMICLHPEDFTLFYLGDFDTHTAGIRAEATPVSLGLAIQYKKDE